MQKFPHIAQLANACKVELRKVERFLGGGGGVISFWLSVEREKSYSYTNMTTHDKQWYEIGGGCGKGWAN